MNSEQTGSKAGGQGVGARAIVRGEEARVRAIAGRVFASLFPAGMGPTVCQWSDSGALIYIAGLLFDGGGCEGVDALATAGIVPGPEGWCWAAAPADRAARYACRWNARCAFADKHSGPCSCDGEGQGVPPAWLTAAVLAALPADGTPVTWDAIVAVVNTPNGGRLSNRVLDSALAALVASGEIEAVEGGRWRRWGVPEGWRLGPCPDGLDLFCGNDGPGKEQATMYADGRWIVWDEGWATGIKCEGTAKPPTLAAARQAALRACYERGVFAPSAAAKPDPIADVTPAPHFDAPPVDRPVRLRAALLAVLQRGPVRTTSTLLPAIDAAMGERPGLGVATGAEAMRAAREIGARVDGVEWSLPPIPDGWRWRRVIASRWYLAPLDASDPEREAVASLTVDDGVGGVGGLLWRAGRGTWAACESVEEGQSAALTAARLAGLFAAPRAEVAPVSAPAPVERATTPLDALARRLCGAHLYAAGSPGMAAVEADVAALTPLLAAFRAEILAVALARTIDHAAAKRGDSEGTGKADALATAERERDDARTQMAIEAARADRAEAALVVAKGERDAALHNYSRECALSESLRSQLEAAEEARDEAIATVDRVRERLEPVLAAIAGGRPVVPPVPSQSCSFCGKSSNETRIFVAGIGAAPAVICDECAVFSARIVKEARERELAAIAGGREVGK